MDDPTVKTFPVLPAQANQTLAAALRRWLPGQSWAQVRKLVESRRVSINGNLCLDPARRLKADESVRVTSHPKAVPPREEDVRIRHLDTHVVVVEKPAGVTTLRHPEERDWPERRKQLQPTLDEMLPRLIAKAEQGRGRRGPLPRLRPVHRLDRETSGLMVFARTVEAERHLGRQFRKHTVHRRYLAVVIGRVEAQRIESNLVRDRGDGRRGSTTLPDVGKRAITHIRPVEKLTNFTVLECQLETGRTHQIRIHLAELGHPVCGERVYNRPLFEAPLADTSGAPRLALHAAELGFIHPVTGEALRFQMSLPVDLSQFLVRLRKQQKRDQKAQGPPSPEE
jgi:23S rRNA pseudouridine1911/1915/1917 synthase